MKKILFIIICFWLLPINAQDDNEIEVELITIGVGDNYWEAYGHSAIRIKTNHNDYSYGFGYFNFAEIGFFLKFARGEMQYFLGIEQTDIEMDRYIRYGRNIWSQKLNLSMPQKIKLIEKLNYLFQPENRYYHYDYFLNNCTSQIRDILDEVTDGDISKQLKTINTSSSWSDAIFPASDQAWMNLGIAMVLGLPAYVARTQWQLSILPEDFADDIASLNSNWTAPLKLIYQAPSKSPSFLQTHYAMLACVLVILLGIWFKFTATFMLNFWLVLQSLLGVGLLMLWFMTKHTVMAYNINILLFFPLAFLLIFKKPREKLINIYLFINLVWIVTALVMTNLYLLGFCIINILVYTKLRRFKY